MDTFNNIVNGESGVSVRGKLNNAITNLISGDEGINAIWEKFTTLSQEIKDVESKLKLNPKEITYDEGKKALCINITEQDYFRYLNKTLYIQ